jgi:hypothetical protein
VCGAFFIGRRQSHPATKVPKASHILKGIHALCLNVAAARLCYFAGSAWSAKRYMNMRPLYQLQIHQTDAVA